MQSFYMYGSTKNKEYNCRSECRTSYMCLNLKFELIQFFEFKNRGTALIPVHFSSGNPSPKPTILLHVFVNELRLATEHHCSLLLFFSYFWYDIYGKYLTTSGRLSIFCFKILYLPNSEMFGLKGKSNAHKLFKPYAILQICRRYFLRFKVVNPAKTNVFGHRLPVILMYYLHIAKNS